jgi:hypothetical protein
MSLIRVPPRWTAFSPPAKPAPPAGNSPATNAFESCSAEKQALLRRAHAQAEGTGTNTRELSMLVNGGGVKSGAADPGALQRRTHPTAAVDAQAGEARQAGQQLQQGGVADAHAALHRQHPQPGERGQVRRAVARDLVAARDAQLRQHREPRDAGQPLHASTPPIFAVTHKTGQPAASTLI